MVERLVLPGRQVELRRGAGRGAHVGPQPHQLRAGHHARHRLRHHVLLEANRATTFIQTDTHYTSRHSRKLFHSTHYISSITKTERNLFVTISYSHKSFVVKQNYTSHRVTCSFDKRAKTLQSLSF